MNKYTLRVCAFLLVLAVLALGAGGCAPEEAEEHSHDMGTSAPAKEPVQPKTTTAGVKKVTIELKGGKFSPENIEVAAGTTVVWVNGDTATHEIHADDDAFKSGELKPGQSFSLTFNDAAHVMYHCHLHGTERGMITVEP